MGRYGYFLSLFLLIILPFMNNGSAAEPFNQKGNDFKNAQMKAPRVKAAYDEKWEDLKSDISKKGFDVNGFEILFMAYKSEKKVEVWMRSKKETHYSLFKTYDICYYSGGLGPKRHQGDGQVPEGFYNFAVFNPYSSYHLSLGVSYPNKSDKIIGKSNLGGDIMMHGNCVSIGCMPITDTYIKEVYVLAVEARNNGEQTIPICIFPSKMDEKEMKLLNDQYKGNAPLLDFWKDLKVGYDYFETNKKLPNIVVDKNGKYVFN
jgi:murein L,D-transpeptidase YafK